jgi:pyruvate dehydrogenase E1 component alpha subunit
LGDRKPVLVHLGIGSASDGAFYEALNLAALHQAPVIFLVAVHPLDGDAPLSQQVATSPHRIAEALGIAVDRVDANTNAVRDAVRDACARNAPTLIEAQLPGATPS